MGLLLAHPVRAHDSRIVMIDVVAAGGGTFQTAWRMPDTLGTQLIGLDLGPRCASVAAPTRRAEQWRQVFDCTDDPVDIGLRYSRFAPAVAVLLNVTWSPAQVHRVTFPVGSEALTMPPRESVGSALSGYVQLGLEHILGGWDHLLFVLGLAVLASGWRRLVFVVTGFTLGHSISLSLGALGLVNARMAAVETLIAFSLVILAAELARRDRATWSWRFPLVMSAGFGLLHGFGFGAALTDIGLPQTTLLPALFAFNVGVELGQLAFLGVLAAAWFGLKALFGGSLMPPAQLAAYVIGVPAAFWTIERAIAGFAA